MGPISALYVRFHLLQQSIQDAFFRCRWSHSAGWIIADQAVPNESGGDTPTQCSERGCANAADDALLRQVRNCISLVLL